MSRSPMLATMQEAVDRKRVGGKAAGLYRLLELDLPVPPFVVLTTEAYRVARAAGPVGGDLPAAVETSLDDAWHLLGAGEAPLAVRSSAVAEDGTERSYAGQMETFLNVTDRAALSKAVAACWTSLHGERAAAYRASGAVEGAAVDQPPPAMAVVVQRMVEPDSSGVLFTVNPAAGRADEVLVSSVWGLGEGLVSGALDADTFVLERTGKVKEARLAEKAQQVRADPAGGTVMTSVPEGDVRAASLDGRTLALLVEHALHAEEVFGRPLDVEFAVAGGDLYFLQARPVTGFVARSRPEDGNRQLWDNSNIVESYPGITLPLTFSFIRRAYHAVYWQFCQVLGLSEEEIREYDPMLGNMLGLIRGRVYYNLHNWYRLVALLPGFSFNRRFMESMMGVGESLATEASPADVRHRRRGALLRLVRTGVRAIGLHRSLDRRIEEFYRQFDEAHAHFSAIDYAELQPAEILRHYRQIERQILWRWKAPIINDFSVMIFHGILKRLTSKWRLDDDGSLANALLSGQGDIESTEVVDRLQGLAAQIGADPEFRDRFVAAQPASAVDLLRRHAVHGAALAAYLEDYGDRCIAELKLESKSMRDDPRFCVAMLQSYLTAAGRGRTAAPGRSGRQAAEAALKRRLSGLRRLPRRWLFGWVLRHARRGIRDRENQRLARTRAFAIARRMFRALGSYLCRNGLIADAEDVFYLRLEEIADFVDGSSPHLDLRSLVDARRRQYRLFESEAPPPDRFETWGPVGLAVPMPTAAPESGQGDVLEGLGAFPGVVERAAAVIFQPDPTLRLDGEILVTRQTDPGWVVLFPSISGLIVERGSMLSHSAIVAREMGIPAVVGVRGATDRIANGDLVRLDGGRGTVEVLAPADGGAPP